MKLFISGLGIAAFAGACTTQKSEDIKTSGFYADIEARTDGTGTTDVLATLYLGQPINLDFVELTGGDKLTAANGSSVKTMTETNILNIVSHEATFDTGNEGDEFEVALTRADGDNAPSSVATLPAAFEVDQPPPTTSRAADFGLTWAPGGSQDPMDWSASGDCIDATTGAVPNNEQGEVTIAANTFVQKQGATSTTCDITIVVQRHVDGALDPHYGKGGSVTGTQFRSVTFSSTP